MGFSQLFIDVSTLPNNAYGFIQLLTLGGFYGYLLMFASNLISDGSELLLLVPSLAGMIGSIVLPVLGAVPDGSIVLFSGLGPNAQVQLDVGVGALAGSTIMLLTIPWFLAILGGRVDLVNDKPNYKGNPKLSKSNEYSLFATGVALSPAVNYGAIFMMITTIPYFILQIPGFVFLHDPAAKQRHGERPWAILGLIVCILFLASYLYYQYVESQKGLEGNAINDKREEFLRAAIRNKKITLLGLIGEEFKDLVNSENSDETTTPIVSHENTPLSQGKNLAINSIIVRLKSLCKPFYDKYDRDNSGSLDIEELATVFHDMGEDFSQKELKELFKKMDTDGSGSIDYDEFVKGTAEFVLSRLQSFKIKINKEIEVVKDLEQAESEKEKDDDEEGEEEEEMPPDLSELDPEEQQLRIKLRSLWMMGLGTAVVLLVSDPMVDVLSEIGTRTNISTFYVSFVLAPVASNLTEVIASYNYAKRKTSKTISVSLATLEGAAVLNNTFVLAVFMLLIVVRGLIWEYCAETLTILLVELAVAILSYYKTVHTLADGLLVLSLYPLSLGLVALLEYFGWN